MLEGVLEVVRVEEEDEEVVRTDEVVDEVERMAADGGNSVINVRN